MVFQDSSGRKRIWEGEAPGGAGLMKDTTWKPLPNIPHWDSFYRCTQLLAPLLSDDKEARFIDLLSFLLLDIFHNNYHVHFITKPYVYI